MVVVATRPALLVAFATIVCGPEVSTPVVNDHDVVPVASENEPESTDTSTFCMPDGSDAVPVIIIEPVPRIAPVDGEVIVTIGDAARAVSGGNENSIVATSNIIDKNGKIPLIMPDTILPMKTGK